MGKRGGGEEDGRGRSGRERGKISVRPGKSEKLRNYELYYWQSVDSMDGMAPPADWEKKRNNLNKS